MLTLDREKLAAMSKDAVIKHALALQAEKEVAMKFDKSVLNAMSKSNLVDHVIIVQDEIQWLRLQAMTSEGAG